MTDDPELLTRYARDGDDAALAELVRRHLNFVYSVALRTTGDDAHLAQEVCQDVFLAVARKAGPLSRHPVFKSWLHTAAQFSAAKAVRASTRRRAREQEAHRMHELNAGKPGDPRSADLRPVIDAALNHLGDTDRAALLLRFFEDCSFAEIGRRLNLSEDAARMRTERALDKVSGWLLSRGIRTPAAAVAFCLAQQAAVAAPPSIAPIIVGAMKSSFGATSTGLGHLITMTQAKIAGTIALGLALSAMLVFQHNLNAQLRTERDDLTANLARAKTERVQQRRATTVAGSASDPSSADADELARLRTAAAARLAALPSPGTLVGATDLKAGLIPTSALRNRGNATPEAAFETLYWAKYNKDVDAVMRLVGTTRDELPPIRPDDNGLPKEDRAKVAPGTTPAQFLELQFAGKTPAQRALYPDATTPEQFYIRNWIDRSGREAAISVNTVTMLDSSRAYLSGHFQPESGTGLSNYDLVLQHTDEGWKWFPAYTEVRSAIQTTK